MNQKEAMIKQIEEIARRFYNQDYEYINLTKAKAVIDEVLGEQEVCAFYTTDRIIHFDYLYTEGIGTTFITNHRKLYDFSFEAASIRYYVVDLVQVITVEVLEFLPDALLSRKDKQIQMQMQSRVQSLSMWLDATSDETKQLKAFIAELSNQIGKTAEESPHADSFNRKSQGGVVPKAHE